MRTQDVAAVLRLPFHWKRFVRAYYKFPPKVNIVHCMKQRGITVLDVTLMLARRQHTRVALEAIVGRPITVGPSFKLSYRRNGASPIAVRDTCWRDRPIVYVDRNVSKKYGHKLRVRCTPRILYEGGVPWRTLQHAVASGWMRVRQ